MVRNLRRTLLFVALVASFLAAASGYAQAQSDTRAHVLITQNVDEGQLVTLAGNTRPEATPENDRGGVAENLLLEHMLLQLKRSPEQEQALQKFIGQQYDPKSPNFHQWLTAEQFGQSYGLEQQDLDTITRWLQSHGLVVNKIYPGGMVIDFSGTAAQVREAFRTEIHNLDVNGVAHISNMQDPQIPAALEPAVLGVVSLNDFRPHPMVRMRPNYTFTSDGLTNQAVVPADLETIYNLNPLFTSGISGQGQTVVLIEDTNVKGSTDWNTFRTTFGLSSFTGATFTQVQPGGCTNPGVNGDDIEALLDIEYASATAPSAAIELASCADTITTFGGLIAVQNLVSGANPPAVISMSYGECEALTGAAANGAFNSAFQQGSVEGISIFVSAGDDSASGCDRDAGSATHGIGITGWGETPYNVSVGGTDFGDAATGTTSTYWNSTNTSTFGSAKSYIPEIPWDDSCASVLLANSFSFSTTYGSTGFCNSTTGKEEFLTTSGGSGGPSGCATGSPTISGVVSGTCAGYAKPSWQVLVGVPNDGLRDIPDVSLFSANGVWGHYYLFCDSDVANGGTACTGSPSGWSGAGGTSFASPILAAIQALVNQKTNSRQGNPNQVYYSLAATEYGSTGSTSCNSSLGSGVGSSCIFYDVTSGDMDVNCKGTHNCYIPSGTNGVLSTSNTAYDKAYGTTTGWDFATGIGTINAANLVNGWPAGSATPDFSLSATSPVTIVQGGSGPSTVTITPLDGFSGSVTLSASGLPSGVTAAFNPNPATTTSTLTLTATSTATTGTVTVTITGTSGALTHTTTISLTVNPASTGGTFALSASPTTVTISQGGAAGTSTITITPQGGFSGSVTLSASGLPSGVTATFTPNPATSTSTLSLTASSTATVGTVSLRIVGTSGTLTARASLTLTVNSGSSGGGTFTLSASPTSLAITRGGAAGTSAITITPQSGFTGGVTLTTSALPSGVTATFTPNPATSTSTLSLTASSTATAGASSVTVTGTSGTIVKTVTIKLRVQ
jgi:subtilase family serine protease